MPSLISEKFENSVSVVMTVYKNDDFQHFSDALESICNQTLTPSEILIVVDGDVSIEMNSFLASKLSLRIIRNKKSVGAAAARNIGISKAESEWIAIMDADDISMPHRLESQLSYVIDRKVDIVSSDYLIINQKGELVGKRILPHSSQEVLRYAPFFCPLANPAVFGRREIFVKSGYVENLKFGEDYRLWINLLKMKFKLGNCDQFLIKYRENESFFGRRNGFSKAWSDFITKILALTLLPLYMTPLAIVMAICTLLVRILPNRALRHFYSFRKLLNYYADKGAT